MTFVRNLWKALWDYCDPGRTGEFFAVEFELAIHAALQADKYGWTKRRSLPFVNWPAMINVAEDMVEAHYFNGEWTELNSRKLASKWMPAVGNAVGWTFKLEKNVGSESEDSDENGDEVMDNDHDEEED
jgi:hypothetical protein